MTKSRRYWVTRDGPSGIMRIYKLWIRKPKFYIDGWQKFGGCSIAIYYAQFELFTNLRLPGGPTSIVEITGFKAVRVKK